MENNSPPAEENENQPTANIGKDVFADNYANEQKARMAKLVVGGRDSSGYEISKIYAYGAEYKIYEIKNFDGPDALRIAIDTKIEANRTYEQHYLAITDELDKLKSTLYKTSVGESYLYRAAHAVQVALEGDEHKAKERLKIIQLDAIEEYKLRQSGKISYFRGAAIVAGLALITALIVYLNRLTPFVIANQVLATYVYAVSFATFGGLLSISKNLNELNLGIQLNGWAYEFYGAVRQLFSILGGIMVFTLIKSDLAFSFVKASGSYIFAILALSFLAGFSETLIPNALRKVEGQDK